VCLSYVLIRRRVKGRERCVLSYVFVWRCGRRQERCVSSSVLIRRRARRRERCVLKYLLIQVGQNRIRTPYMAVYLVKVTPLMHHMDVSMCMVLANPSVDARPLVKNVLSKLKAEEPEI